MAGAVIDAAMPIHAQRACARSAGWFLARFTSLRTCAEPTIGGRHLICSRRQSGIVRNNCRYAITLRGNIPVVCRRLVKKVLANLDAAGAFSKS